MNPTRSTLFFILGLIIAFTPLLAPVHELGHYLVAWISNDQEEFQWMTWSTTHGILNAMNIVSGYYFEIIVFTIVALLCIVFRTSVAFFFLGYAQCTWVLALNSVDFNSYARQVADYLNKNPERLIEGFTRPWVINGLILWVVIDLTLLIRRKTIFLQSGRSSRREPLALRDHQRK